MKFSYSLLKKFVPKIPSKKRLFDELSMKSLETEDVKGDTIEIKVLNRYSDAASHWGMSREIAAVFDIKKNIPEKTLINIPEDLGLIKVKINDPDLCPRYIARYFKIKKTAATPAWMKKALISCGMRPINIIVDIMNYVMLETGQPLHAFDADKSGREIVVRRAEKDEKITSLDNVSYSLDKDMLVIADKKEPLAVAGIKGGKTAEVDRKSRFIIVEAASFNGSSIYTTSRKLGLVTDASLRFAHGLSPHLAQIGADRATVLFKEILGARLIDSKDVHKKLPSGDIIEFNVPKFNGLIGLDLSPKAVIDYLKRLGFGITLNKKRSDTFLVEVPVLRDDVTIFEDLCEEVARLHGYDKLPPSPPKIGLVPSETDDTVKIKDEVRMILVGLGFSEVYNHTFLGKRSAAAQFLPLKDSQLLEVENPISSDQKFLRSELITGLSENIRYNEKLQEDLLLFEVGKVWVPREELHLGIAVHSQTDESFLDLKGFVHTLLERVGLEDFVLVPRGSTIFIEADNMVIGFISAHNRKEAFAELDLDKLLKLVSGKNEFRPLPKYPAITRDLSLLVPNKGKVGDLIDAIWEASVSDIEDVDLIDYYDPTRFTFRIIFRSASRTLNDGEANTKLDQIIKYLRARFDFKVR